MARATTEPDEDDVFDECEDGPLAPARKPLPWLRIALLSAAMVAGLVHLAQNADPDALTDGPRQVPNAVLTAPAPSWKAVAKPAPVFAIEQSPAPASLQAREHSSGRREDTLSLRGFGQPGFAQVAITRGGAGTRPRSLFVETVHRAAEAGLSITRNAPSRTLATKFGALEAAAVTLAGPAEQSCQVFRFADGAVNLQVHGWLCGSEAEPVDDARLACFVDRLSLVNEADLTLKAFFAEAEARRPPACGPDARTASVERSVPIRR